MPKPKPNESKEEYISRAIETFKKEGFEQKEAIGRAYGFWDYYSKKNKKNTKEKK